MAEDKNSYYLEYLLFASIICLLLVLLFVCGFVVVSLGIPPTPIEDVFLLIATIALILSLAFFYNGQKFDRLILEKLDIISEDIKALKPDAKENQDIMGKLKEVHSPIGEIPSKYIDNSENGIFKGKFIIKFIACLSFFYILLDASLRVSDQIISLSYIISFGIIIILIVYGLHRGAETYLLIVYSFLWAVLLQLVKLLFLYWLDTENFVNNLSQISLVIALIAFILSMFFSVQSKDDNSRIMKRFDKLEESDGKLDNITESVHNIGDELNTISKEVHDIENKNELLNDEIKTTKTELKEIHLAIQNLQVGIEKILDKFDDEKDK